MDAQYDVVIVGGGLAGLTAGMYAGRYGLKTVVIEEMMGGAQVINLENIANFPGFPQGVIGAELAPLVQEQAMNAGSEMRLGEVIGIEIDGEYRIVATTDHRYQTKCIIVSAGSRQKKMGIPGEQEFNGRGVSHCASCDGPMYAREVVGVVGGGDSALDEALALTNYVERVILFHRSEQLQAQKVLQNQVMAHPKIDVVWNTNVEAILGDSTVTGAQVRNVVTNLSQKVELSGMFIYVGLEPNSSFVKSTLKIDAAGHIPVNLWMETEVAGIYAVGDIRQNSSSQLISAAGDGATAAVAAFNYINSRSWANE